MPPQRYMQPHVGINPQFGETGPHSDTLSGRYLGPYGRGPGGLEGPAWGLPVRAGGGLNTFPHNALRLFACLCLSFGY